MNRDDEVERVAERLFDEWENDWYRAFHSPRIGWEKLTGPHKDGFRALARLVITGQWNFTERDNIPARIAAWEMAGGCLLAAFDPPSKLSDDLIRPETNAIRALLAAKSVR